jgi:hypothetical protein
MRVSSLSGRWVRAPAAGAALMIVAAALASCGTGSSHALSSDNLSPAQAKAYAKSQFTTEDRQAATVLSPQPGSFLAGKDTVTLLGSTTPPSGDTLPYGIWPVTKTIGSVTAGDVLVDNFADASGRLGTGTSIVDVHPDGTVSVFATIPRTVSGCPGGVGLTTALVQLETGWVIVGTLPTTNGKLSTATAGCLLELSPTGAVVGTITGGYLDGPWGATVRDNGATATLFVSNTLVGIDGSTTKALQGDVIRLSLAQSPTAKPSVVAEARVARGFAEQSDATALIEGPSGLALSASGTLYVADTVGDRIVSIPGALTGPGSTGSGTTLSRAGQLAQPFGLVVAPDGDLLATNTTNGKIVEITVSGRQVGEYYADQDVDQDPPGHGELTGLAVDQAGTGVVFAKDEANTLDVLH